MKLTLFAIASITLATFSVAAEKDPDLDDPRTLEEVISKALLMFQEIELRLEEKMFYRNGAPYTGWSKMISPETGRVTSLSHFKEGKQDGVVLMWHDNGKLSLKSHFKNGKKDGVVTWWHDDGKISKREIYKDGELQR